MFERTSISLIILVLCSIYCYHCLTIIPERAIVTYVNEKYFTNVTANVRRSSRRGKYAFNSRVISKTVLGNNVTFHMTFYERSSRYNQYIRTLIEFHYKWCELVLHDALFGPSVRKYGIKECPTPPGPVVISNMTFSAKFPFEVLFDKGKLELIWKVASTGEVMGSVDVFVTFSKSRL